MTKSFVTTPSAHKMQLNDGLTRHPEHAALIAKLIAQWSAIEDAYTRLFSYFIGVNFFSASQLFASLVASRARLDLFEAAGDYFFQGDEIGHAAFRELVSLLRARLRERNRFAHAVYGTTDAGELTIIRRARELSDPGQAVEPLPLDEVRAAWAASAFTFNTTLRFHITLHSQLPDAFLKALHVVWSHQSGAVRNNVRAANIDEENSAGDLPTPSIDDEAT